MIRSIMTEKIFPNGLIYKKAREGAPDFVKGTLSVKVDEFIEFLTKHKDERGWVNIDLLESREGKPYCVLNSWKPETKEGQSSTTAGANKEVPIDEIDTTDIPF